ncbi:MAG: hypothetical protein BGO95_04625 [Micrococcales bacterium 73-13]|nr:MAG: hypothetical protein BGO95_04625 [Micrococcales bacterium 73-13]
MARGSAGESALHRHLRVLSAFDARHPYLTLTEVAERAGLAKSTVHRLVGELEREGLVERGPDRLLRLGVRIFELASRTPGALGLREIARPYLQAVQARIRQHVQLGVLAGTDVLFVERLSQRDAVLNATLIGGRIPLHASSSGLVLLASAPAALVDEVVAAGIRVYTEHTIRTAAELRRVLRRVRADGFAETRGHIHPDSRGIAVPVLGPHRTVYAALGVVVANDGTSALPYVETLRLAAAGITRELEAVFLPEHGIRELVRSSDASLAYLETDGPPG